MTQESLRAAIGMVTQDTSLLHRSIAANIRYGRPGASDAQVDAAARKAQAHEFIVGPAGLEGPHRLRRARRRARRQALRRPAPAHRDRARGAEGRADPGARRSDLGARQRGRARDPGAAARPDGRQDGDRDRAPPVDHRAHGPPDRARRRAASSSRARTTSCCAWAGTTRSCGGTSPAASCRSRTIPCPSTSSRKCRPRSRARRATNRSASRAEKMLRITELRLPLDHAESALRAADRRAPGHRRRPTWHRLHRLQAQLRRAQERRDRADLHRSTCELRDEADSARSGCSRPTAHVRPDARHELPLRRPRAAPTGRRTRARWSIGFGPCGIFAALILAQMGFRPIVLERGKAVRERTKDTWGLWRKSVLEPGIERAVRRRRRRHVLRRQALQPDQGPAAPRPQGAARVRQGRRAGGNPLRQPSRTSALSGWWRWSRTCARRSTRWAARSASSSA